LLQAGAVISDFSPLRLPRAWKQETAKQLEMAFWEVDARSPVQRCPAGVALHWQDARLYEDVLGKKDPRVV